MQQTHHNAPPAVIELGERRVELQRNEVHFSGRIEVLTPSESKLLRYLVENANRTVPHAELLQKVWSYAPTSRSRTVQSTIGRLRKKIEEDPSQPRFLLSVYGSGYRLALPRATSPTFLGRAAELDALLPLSGALALVGPGGVGKSRLAREAALASSHSWARASLLAVRDLEGVLLVLGAACGVAGSRTSSEAHLRQLASAAPELVVLDDAEYVPEAAAHVALALAAASKRVLVTSRVEIPGVRSLPVEPLSREDAVELLVRCIERAGGQRPSGDLGPVVDALDRLPLAIELGAGQASLVPIHQLPERLDWAFASEREGRHASVVGSVRATLELLRPEHREALSLLAVYSQGFDVALAEALLGPGALSTLDALKKAWLLRRDETRLRLPETVRWVARQHAPADAVDRAARALLALPGTPELPNARELLDQASPVVALELVDRYERLVLKLAPLEEWERWLARGIQVSGSLEHWDLHLRLTSMRPHLLQWRGDTQGALAEARRLERRAEQLGESRRRWLAGRDVATFLRRLGRVDEALAHVGTLLDALPSTLPDVRILLLSERSDGLQQAGRFDDALQVIDQVIDAHVAAGNRHKEGMATGQKARCLRSMGRTRTAIAHYRACVGILHEVDDDINRSIYLGNLANAQMDAALLDEARKSLDAGLALAEARGDRMTLAYQTYASGRLHRLAGATERASAVLIEAIHRLRALRLPQAEATAHAELALALWDQGADTEALAALGEAEALLGGLPGDATVQAARSRAVGSAATR